MSNIAKKQRPGRRKPFSKIIDEIVRQNPSISHSSLLHRLKRHEEINVIDNKIIYHEPHDEMPVSGLSQALNRSKARLQKNIKNIDANAVSVSRPMFVCLMFTMHHEDSGCYMKIYLFLIPSQIQL